MAQSLEIRVPFVDLPLLREAAPWLAAYPDVTKAEVARAVNPKLPDSVLARPKTGFSVPVREWLLSGKLKRRERGLRGWARYIHGSFTGAPGKRVLLLTTDAYGGHGGIALYNRDIIEALAAMPEIGEIVIVPRNAPLPLEPIPAKARFLAAAIGGKVRYVMTALLACGKPFDLTICGHINLLPLASLLSPVLRAPLVLMVYWHRRLAAADPAGPVVAGQDGRRMVDQRDHARPDEPLGRTSRNPLHAAAQRHPSRALRYGRQAGRPGRPAWPRGQQGRHDPGPPSVL